LVSTPIEGEEVWPAGDDAETPPMMAGTKRVSLYYRPNRGRDRRINGRACNKREALTRWIYTVQRACFLLLPSAPPDADSDRTIFLCHSGLSEKGGKSGRKDSQCPLRVIKTVENTVFYPVVLHSWICVCGRTMIYHQKIQNRMVLRLGLPTECHVKRPCVVHTLAHYKFRRYVKLCNLYR
jgi:hypothetical protein